MISTQVIVWLVLGSVFALVASAQNLPSLPSCEPNTCKKEDYGDAGCSTIPPCTHFLSTTPSTTPLPRGDDWLHKPNFENQLNEHISLEMKVRSPLPTCCEILSAAFKRNETDLQDGADAQIRISEDKIANRCRSYEQLVPGCKDLCPLYEMMCKNTREFIEGVQCYKNFADMPLSMSKCRPAFGDLGNQFEPRRQFPDDQLSIVSSDTEIAGNICALKLSYLKCVERNISAACGWMGTKVGMMFGFGHAVRGVERGNPFDDKYSKIKLFAPVSRLALLDSRCAEFVSHLAKYQSSPSRQINLELLISVAIIVALLALKPHQTGFGHSSWVLLIVILCVSAENVLSEDAPIANCENCGPRVYSSGLTLNFGQHCCHLFSKIIGEAGSSDDLNKFTGELQQPSMEKAANHCKLFENNMTECKGKCEVSKLICNSPKDFFEGAKCINSLLWDLRDNIPDKYKNKKYYPICEKEYNATWALRENAAATYSSICEAKLNYFKCIEQNFTKECGQVGRYLGIRKFFWNKHEKDDENHYTLAATMLMRPNTRELKCLEYVNYVGTHLDVSYSSSVRNTAMGFVFAFAIAKLGMARHLAELR